jgi:hypothetical protein
MTQTLPGGFRPSLEVASRHSVHKKAPPGGGAFE